MSKELVVALTKAQTAQVVGMVGTVVALEEAEKAFDVSAKGLITLFDDVFNTVDKSKGNMKVRANAVAVAMIASLSTVDELSDTVFKRASSVINTISDAIAKGVLLKTKLIPFTTIQHIVKNVVAGLISKKELTALSKVEDTEYVEACKKLLVKSDYKGLVGSVDYSMLDDGLVTTIKALDKDSINALAGLVKIVKGA